MTKTNEIKTNETKSNKGAELVAKLNERDKDVTNADVRKEIKENLTFSSVSVEFKKAKFEKAVIAKYFLSNEELKNLKSELKVLKNIDNISNITIEEIAPNKEIKDDDGKTNFVCTAKMFHFNNFKNNAIKFTKNNFDLILKTIDERKQLAIFRKCLLLCADEKNTSISTSELVMCGAKKLVKKFIIKIVTEYCKG